MLGFVILSTALGGARRVPVIEADVVQPRDMVNLVYEDMLKVLIGLRRLVSGDQPVASIMDFDLPCKRPMDA